MIEKVSFKNSSGQRIVGLLQKPKKGGKLPLVIVTHGFKGYKEQPHLVAVANVLAKQGIAVFRFDFTNGVGESDGEIEDLSFDHYVKDLKVVVDYFSKKKYVDNNKLGLVGHSLGSTTGLVFAAGDRRIKRLVMHSSTLDAKGKYKRDYYQRLFGKKKMREWKTSGQRTFWVKKLGREVSIPYTFLTDREQVKFKKAFRQLRASTLVIHGERDEGAPVKQAIGMTDALETPTAFEMVKGVPHTPKLKSHIDKVASLTADWFLPFVTNEFTTVTAVVSHRDKILIMKRNAKYVGSYGGKWNVVAGYLQTGEKPLDRAKQELIEETGLGSAQFKLVKSGRKFKIYDKSINKIWHVYPFLFRSKTAKIKLDKEHTEYRWIKPVDLGEFKTVYKLEESLKRVL